MIADHRRGYMPIILHRGDAVQGHVVRSLAFRYSSCVAEAAGKLQPQHAVTRLHNVVCARSRLQQRLSRSFASPQPRPPSLCSWQPGHISPPCFLHLSSLNSSVSFFSSPFVYHRLCVKRGCSTEAMSCMIIFRFSAQANAAAFATAFAAAILFCAYTPPLTPSQSLQRQAAQHCLPSRCRRRRRLRACREQRSYCVGCCSARTNTVTSAACAVDIKCYSCLACDL
jgi:hypothetical protein